MADELLEKTLAIVFVDMPPNYTCMKILLNELTANGRIKKSKSINMKRWCRALRMIKIDQKNQGTVAFSSIFYWCKYSRHIIKRKELNAKIHPKFYENIERSSCIDFIASNCNQQLIRLFTLADGVISYLFLHNQCIYISTKPANDHEYLIKIPSKSMAAVKLLIGTDQQQDHSLIFELNQSAEVYEYYHRTSVWNCSQCGSVNDISISKCIACNTQCEKENPVHFLTQKLSKMDLNLNSKKHVFSKQSRFYRKLSSFVHTTNSSDSMFNVLSPFFNVLDDNKRDLCSSIMFTNTIKMTLPFKINVKEWKHKLDCHLSGSLQTEIVSNFPIYTTIDFRQCREQLDSCMMWWEQPQNWYYVFPILRKLIDFRNPAFLCEQYQLSDQIRNLIGQFSPSDWWLFVEALSEYSNENVEPFGDVFQRLEEKYDALDQLDQDDDDKAPRHIYWKQFAYDVQLTPFSIKIARVLQSELMGSRAWVALNKASTQNYVVSFSTPSMSSHHQQHDLFGNLKQIMHYKSYIFTHPANRHEMMHGLNMCFDGDFKQYAATVLSNFTSDHKLVERHKERNILNKGKDGEGGDYFDFYDEADDCYIDEDDVYQPPMKRQKVMDKRHESDGVIDKYSNSKPEVTKEPKKELIEEGVSKSQDEEDAILVPKEEIQFDGFAALPTSNDDESIKRDESAAIKKEEDRPSSLVQEQNEQETQPMIPPMQQVMEPAVVSNQEKNGDEFEFNDFDDAEQHYDPNGRVEFGSIQYEPCTIIEATITDAPAPSSDPMELDVAELVTMQNTCPNAPISQKDLMDQSILTESMSASNPTPQPDSVSPPPTLGRRRRRKRKRNQISDDSDDSEKENDGNLGTLIHSENRQNLLVPPSRSNTGFRCAQDSSSDESRDQLTIPKPPPPSIDALSVDEKGVGWAFDVPIYNKAYFQCADFPTDHRFPTVKFAQLCIDFACRTDLVIRKDMPTRGGRTRHRVIREADEVQAAFLKGCPDGRYSRLFAECFTTNKRDIMFDGKTLLRYLTESQKKKRVKEGVSPNKRFVIYEKRYGVKESMKNRLYLLLSMYFKHTVWGVVNVDTETPPWYDPSDDDVMEAITAGINNVNVIDLTSYESDDEDGDVAMPRHNRKEVQHYGEVRVKTEPMWTDEHEYASE